MIIELGGCLIAGGVIAGANFLYYGGGGNDHKKIEIICKNCGLFIKDEKSNSKKTIRIFRKSSIPNGIEYVYQIPIGMKFKDFESKIDNFQDGLNAKRSVLDFSLQDLKQLKLDRTIIKQIQMLSDKRLKLRKEVELLWDGMLKVRVYNEPLPTMIPLTDEMLSKCNGWEIPLGVSRKGLIKHDMENGHMCVAGITQYGKTVFLKMLVTSLIHRKPQDAQFHLLDLKGGLAFNRFKKCSQVKDVAYDLDSSLEVLEKIMADMRARWTIFREKGFENIRDSKIKTRNIIIVDEGAELSSAGTKGDEQKKKRKCEQLLSEIARLGNGLGYRLIYCTQYPTADVLPRQIKQNSPTKIAFKLTNQTASEVVIDESGAEKLPLIQGRCIVLRDKKEIVQCPYIDNDFITKKITPHINILSRSEDVELKKAHSQGAENRRNIKFFEKPRLSQHNTNKSSA